jgi:hypothetical protein
MKKKKGTRQTNAIDATADIEKNAISKAFIDSEAAGESDEIKGHAAQKLIEELLLEHLQLTNVSPEEQAAAIRQVRERQQSLDGDDPACFASEKILKRLGSEHYALGVSIAEANIDLKAVTGSAAISEQNRANRSKTPKNSNDVDRFFQKALQQNPSITAGELLHRVSEQEGVGTIKKYDRINEEIVGTDDQCVSSNPAAIESRLRRMRKNNKIEN